MEVFVGWDVGAWNCDRNRESRDAICAVVLADSELAVVGNAWRGNTRDVLVEHTGTSLVRALLQRVGVSMRADHHVTIAIDTPLAWPKRMLDLVTERTLSDVPAEADCNPYLFRAQELALFGEGYRPLSTVRDMIGSQSTKGIHFLLRAGLAFAGAGHWTNSDSSVVAIETYPAAAVRDVDVARLTADLLGGVLERERQPRSDAWQGDVRDAITCALIAWLHRRHPSRLRAPDPGASGTEGWIWLPRTDANVPP